jgi:hypothetical protein
MEKAVHKFKKSLLKKPAFLKNNGFSEHAKKRFFQNKFKRNKKSWLNSQPQLLLFIN